MDVFCAMQADMFSALRLISYLQVAKFRKLLTIPCSWLARIWELLLARNLELVKIRDASVVRHPDELDRPRLS